ncbi:MAG: hypothetical protein HFF39_08230 [Lawsonibacter sp.]|nr:hypothetical protein [Lawsonibacter sp.]
MTDQLELLLELVEEQEEEQEAADLGRRPDAGPGAGRTRLPGAREERGPSPSGRAEELRPAPVRAGRAPRSGEAEAPLPPDGAREPAGTEGRNALAQAAAREGKAQSTPPQALRKASAAGARAAGAETAAAPLRRQAAQAARAARFRVTAGGSAPPEAAGAKRLPSAPEEAAPLRARSLDRVFERDARRYDGVFTLY